ncbi:hypothetical protein EAH80_04270 [Mycobacterium hodleri]|uniref:Uncharacterized protein n=1 Tax=Mycolicibacterium hodleri TaxID=49897 RepID=A0A502EKM8_9MYCO|nr:hypothetical protein EAH80_04270 [Mycolicibacterium hodleri]
MSKRAEYTFALYTGSLAEPGDRNPYTDRSPGPRCRPTLGRAPQQSCQWTVGDARRRNSPTATSQMKARALTSARPARPRQLCCVAQARRLYRRERTARTKRDDPRELR